MRFRPTFWATIVFLPVFILLLGLGTWQVQRLGWKNNLIETRVARISSPVLDIADAKAAAAPDLIEYRPIRLSGVFQTAHKFRLLNRLYAGTQGSHLVVPMVLDNGQGTIMVDRGWIPRGPVGNDYPMTSEPIVLEGFVRAYTEPGAFLPENEPDTNNWFHMDEGELLTAAGLSDGVGFYVEAGPGKGVANSYPAGAIPDVNLRNSHLQYAGTWYSFAGVLLIIFVVFHWRREN